MPILNRALVAALLAACATTALAQAPPPTGAAPRVTSPVESRRGDTPRFDASQTAGNRAHFTCGGLFNSHQPPEQLDQGGRPPAGAEMKMDIDMAAKTVSVTYDPKMPPRIVVWRPVIGCIQLPTGASMEMAAHLPSAPAGMSTPNFDDRPWPMGDRDAAAKLPRKQQAAMDALIQTAFDGTTYGGKTWGVVVIKDGKIIGERYGMGFDVHMGGRTHSAAKSFASTIAGMLVKEGKITSLDKGPVLKEWSHPGDPRGEITFNHLMRMSSGLYVEGAGNPMFDIYNSGALVSQRLTANILDSRPGTRFLYSPPDTMLATRAMREAVADDKRWVTLPYTDLFWKIGMTRTTQDMDWGGDFLMSGVAWSTARDFGRFGLFYLNDGVWNGERLLPEGWAKYVATNGPVQPPPGGAGYGAFFWTYGGRAGLPADAFSPNGGQGQYAMIIRSKGVVVVRRGFDERAGFKIAEFSADVLKVLEKK